MTRSSPTYPTCPTHMATRPSLPTLCTLPRDLPYLPSPPLSLLPSLSPSPSPLSVQGAEFRVMLCSSAGIRQPNTWRSMPLQIREPPMKSSLLLKSKRPSVSTSSHFGAFPPVQKRAGPRKLVVGLMISTFDDFNARLKREFNFSGNACNLSFR